MRETGGFEFPPFKWWVGVVENRKDPKELGRLQVRIYGYHTGDKGKMSSDSLPWAVVSQGITSAANSGVGYSPTGIVEGTTVIGFFMDGEQAQTPVILGTLAGMNSGEGFEGGFKDPNSKYPRKKGENDVNKLARGKTNDTAVQKRRDSVDTGDVAFGGSWTEPSSPYAAKYPYNHVYESESGHVREFDDTSGSERISEWHRKGTFYEVHPDGTKVEKVVKDHYEVVLGNDYLKVKGNCKIVVDSNASILVKGNADLQVKGNMKQEVQGNYNLDVKGNYTVKVNGTHRDTSNTHRIIKAPRVDINP